MSENGAGAPEQVVKFEPKRQPRSYDTPVEEAGQAIVAKIRRASELANETCDRAMKLAHKLSLELRAAEDRINQLEAEVQLFRDRAARAEGWLQTIYKEIEEKLIAPRSASGTEQKSLGQLGQNVSVTGSRSTTSMSWISRLDGLVGRPRANSDTLELCR